MFKILPENSHYLALHFCNNLMTLTFSRSPGSEITENDNEAGILASFECESAEYLLFCLKSSHEIVAERTDGSTRIKTTYFYLQTVNSCHGTSFGFINEHRAGVGMQLSW